MSLQKEVCETFKAAVQDLKKTFKECDKPTILAIVSNVIALLQTTYRPALDAYYQGEYCKEVYCSLRHYRDNAVTILEYVTKLLPESQTKWKETHDNICEAILWIEKAQTLVCDPDVFVHTSSVNSSIGIDFSTLTASGVVSGEELCCSINPDSYSTTEESESSSCYELNDCCSDADEDDDDDEDDE